MNSTRMMSRLLNAVGKMSPLDLAQIYKSSNVFSCSFISLRNYSKATKKQINAKAKKRWNRENLMLFGPVVRKTRNKNVTNSESLQEKEPEVKHSVENSSKRHVETQGSGAPEDMFDAPLPGEDSVEMEKQAFPEMTDYKQRLQVMLQYPISPLAGSSSAPMQQAMSNMTQISEFQSRGTFGKAYPSVSKILEKSRPPESAFFLERWIKNMTEELGKEGFQKQQRETRDRGSAFHNCVTQVLQGMPRDEVEIPPSVEPLWASLEQVLPHFDLAKFVETPVRHPNLHYSGIFDCVAEYKGRLCLIDWKISKTQKPALSSTFDNPLQLVAYVGALNFDNRYDTQLENALLVIAYDDGQPAHVHSMVPQQCQYYWGQWLRRLHAFWASVMAGEIQL